MSASARAYLLLDDAALLEECDVLTYRASGPGGQKRNKTDSAVRLAHRPTGLAAIGTESRSQHENKSRALARLRRAIAFEVRAPLDSADYEPSPLLRTCISAARGLQCGRRDQRYWLVVAELLDLLLAHRAAVRDTARALDLSTANLVAFFRRDPKLWERVNRFRAEFKLPLLRA